MLNQKVKKNKGAVIAYWLIVAALLAVIICVNPVITVSLKLEKPCSFVYDGTNLRTESYSADGTQVWIYENALSQPSYQYFFVGENAVIDFSTTCEYQTEAITFKDFIDRNYNKSKEFYEQAGAPIDRYGRKIPKHAHGTENMPKYTSSTSQLIDAALRLFDRIINKDLNVRRVTVTACKLLPEDEAKQIESGKTEQGSSVLH